ncbi:MULTISPECIES: SLC13 family permease [Caldilinea]|uniref:Putative transporter n=1 Tax=Caldilinea aerophila (strain DSM 14535 / JCM 11387 / NBRC 104270 / STL-6-O1) TaxID=926550 RepID=I0I5E1_CALAS|nr:MULTISPECIES: SLC13 family permease [Caldilinea]BAM00479.1 putative transporter [Caldilinea aerophila DSM 14535 = NBRC 104270]GIV71829.1 MAG: sodium:sulfate symporter [Caldilinea sp.]
MLPFEQWLLIAIIAASTALYVTNRLPTEVTATATLVALMATGLLSPAEALSGFSSTATITVAAMFVLSAGLMRTGALEVATIYLGRFAKGSARRLLLLLALVETPASAFMNNTPVVVMMIPVVVSLCRQYNLRPSKFLLPVSYFAVLGGTITLLGTSTNILVSELYRKAGGPGFGLFEFSALGLIYAAAGIAFIVLVGHRLLPDYSPLASLTSGRSHTTYVTELIVNGESKINGKTAAEVFNRIALTDRSQAPQSIRRHRRLQGQRARQNDENRHAAVTLLEVLRNGQSLQAEMLRNLLLTPGDILVVSGAPKDIHLFQQTNNLDLATVIEDEERRATTDLEEQVIEAVVMPGSEMVGKPIGQLMLTRRFGVKVMGLQHQGTQQVQGLRTQRLEVGDVLLLRGKTAGLRKAAETCRLLLVEGVENTLVRKTKNTTALIIMASVVLLASLSEIPIVVLALAGAVAMVLTRCLRIDEAIGALETSTLMLLVGTIPIGVAMESTGLVNTLVNGLLALSGDADPRLFLALFYLMTALLTELISNNAVAVLLTPVALSLAASLNISPMPLLVALLFGASAAFMTPFGYQTNAIVMGPGGYRFIDYLRVGAPLQLIMVVIASLAIPVLWPF